ncbi:hypothetical protein KCU89_g13527, partial [Aureobasidium melanogenum]
MPPKGSKKRAAGAEASTSKAKSTKTDASATAGAATDDTAQQEPDVQETGSTSHRALQSQSCQTPPPQLLEG